MGQTLFQGGGGFEPHIWQDNTSPGQVTIYLPSTWTLLDNNGKVVIGVDPDGDGIFAYTATDGSDEDGWGDSYDQGGINTGNEYWPFDFLIG